MSKEVRTLQEWRESVFFEARREFAARLDVPVSTLIAWEQGRNRPTLPRIRRLAGALGIEPSQIAWPEPRAKKRAA